MAEGEAHDDDPMKEDEWVGTRVKINKSIFYIFLTRFTMTITTSSATSGNIS